eukprot:scaffold3666_cov268-Chaetoceros_neogracile.AAC.17
MCNGTKLWSRSASPPAKSKRHYYTLRWVIIVIAALIISLALTFSMLPWKTNGNNATAGNQKTVQLILEEYQQIVKEAVSLQQASWVRHHGWSRIPSQDDNSSNEIQSSDNTTTSGAYQDPVKHKHHEWLDLSTKVDNASGLPVEMFDGIEWDHENNVGGYLDELLSSCLEPRALKRHSLPHFKRCWAFLRRLVDAPLCTTRFDSRVSCSGDKDASLGIHSRAAKDNVIRSSEWHQRGIKVIKEHLTLDTINIIIIGAGPVGLTLANALAELQLADPASPWHVDNHGGRARPNIRILIFENRLETVGSSKMTGRKKPYIRDWLTDLSYRLLIENSTYDPRLVKFLRAIRQLKRNISLPINVLETLFLLSARDRSKVVKLLYDDFRKYRDVLGSVQNAIVFDATGHRLNDLQRPTPPQENHPGTEISFTEYTPDSNDTVHNMRYSRNVFESDLKYLRENDEPFTVATYDTSTAPDNAGGGGIITYPVFPKTQIPYKMQFAKFTGLAHREDFYHEFLSVLPIPSRPICLHFDDRDQHPLWCRPHVFYEYSYNYRPDIEALLYSKSPGFGVRFLLSNLAPSQVVEVQSLIDTYSKTGDNLNGIPLLDIPPNSMRRQVFEENNLDQVLFTVMQNELLSLGDKSNAAGLKSDEGNVCKISIFEYSPYMYTESIYYNDFFGETPIVRVGDSLMTGDSSAATGLTMHLYMITKLKCKILGCRRMS